MINSEAESYSAMCNFNIFLPIVSTEQCYVLFFLFLPLIPDRQLLLELESNSCMQDAAHGRSQ